MKSLLKNGLKFSEMNFPHMDNELTRDDPIKKKFYDPIETSEIYLDVFFWFSIILSFVLLSLDKADCPRLYNFIQIFFCVSVLLIFLLDTFVRLYLKPRADDMRLKDFLSHAYGIPLNHEQTKWYYNNNETDPIRKLAAQLLENSMHSKSTALAMAKRRRILTLGYAVILYIFILNRSTDLEFISIAAQVVFGEYMILYWLRIEWMRMRFERVFDDVSNLFQLNPAKEKFEIKTFEGLTKYETTKANGAVLLSYNIFKSNREKISKDWDSLKISLQIL